MRRSDVLELFFEQLQPRARDNGFAKKGMKLVRNIEGGRQEIDTAIVDYNPKFVLKPFTTVRIDIVEEIFHLFSGTLLEYRSQGFTTVTGFGYFTRGQSAEYTVASERDIGALVERLGSIVGSSIIPFLDQHQNIISLDIGVNRTVPSIDEAQPIVRAMHAVILAHLAENGGFDTIVERHQDQLGGFIEVERHKFEALVAYLRELRGR